MKIAFDIDGCVANIYDYFLQFLKTLYQIDVKLDNLFHANLESVINVDEKTIDELIHYVIRTKAFDAYPHSVETITTYYSLESEPIIFITARPDWVHTETYEWLDLKFKDKIYYFVEFNKRKSKFCLQHNITHVVEDNPTNAYYLAMSGIKVLLLDQPWNQYVKSADNIIRMSNWNEISDYIIRS